MSSGEEEQDIAVTGDFGGTSTAAPSNVRTFLLDTCIPITAAAPEDADGVAPAPLTLLRDAAGAFDVVAGVFTVDSAAAGVAASFSATVAFFVPDAFSVAFCFCSPSSSRPGVVAVGSAVEEAGDLT